MSLRVGLFAPSGKLRAHLRGAGIFDLLEDGECLFGVLNGLRALAELVQHQTHIPQTSAFAAAVANLAIDYAEFQRRAVAARPARSAHGH